VSGLHPLKNRQKTTAVRPISDICNTPVYKARTHVTEELLMDREKNTAFQATYFWRFRQKTLGDKEIFFAHPLLFLGCEFVSPSAKAADTQKKRRHTTFFRWCLLYFVLNPSWFCHSTQHLIRRNAKKLSYLLNKLSSKIVISNLLRGPFQATSSSRHHVPCHPLVQATTAKGSSETMTA
jgi:hypothetical protein